MEKGIVITTNDEISVQEFSRDGYGVLNESLKNVVGDSIKKVNPMYIPHLYCFICNEDGLILHLPINLAGCGMYGTALHGHPIVGNIVLLRLGVYNGEMDVVGISENEIPFIFNWLMNHFPYLKEVSS